MAELIQQQPVNLVGAIQSGYEIGQNARMNNLKMLAAQQEMEQKNQLQALYKSAAAGSPEATQQLSMVAPDAYKGLKDYQTYKVKRGGQMFGSVLNTPLPHRPKEWKANIAEFKKEFGENPDIADEWSPEAEQHLRSLVTQAREVEDLAKQEYEAPKFQAELAKTKAQTVTEGYQQKNYAANINKTGLESQKLSEEISGLKADREAAAQSGLTPSGFKAQQQEFGKARGEKLSLLNSQNAKLPQLLNTVNKLSELGQKATYTSAGLTTDFARRELGISPRESAVARAAYISTVDNQILPLLRDTFGAAFTQKEGESLKVTLGDPNKSPAEKEAVLQSFIQQKVATLNSSAQEIGMNPINPTIVTKGKYSLVGGQLLREGQTATNKATGKKMTFTGGEWQ